MKVSEVPEHIARQIENFSIPGGANAVILRSYETDRALDFADEKP